MDLVVIVPADVERTLYSNGHCVFCWLYIYTLFYFKPLSIISNIGFHDQTFFKMVGEMLRCMTDPWSDQYSHHTHSTLTVGIPSQCGEMFFVEEVPTISNAWNIVDNILLSQFPPHWKLRDVNSLYRVIYEGNYEIASVFMMYFSD